MKVHYLYMAVLAMILCFSLLACSSHSEPEVPVFSYPPQGGQLKPEPDHPLPEPSQPQDQQHTDYIERNIVVDKHNSVFPIGIPSGQQEQTEVSAQELLDIWFEYLPAEATLKINGLEVERDPFHWETKIGHMESVTQFSYSVQNGTGTFISYNLHLLPARHGESVPVIVRQRWIPL